MPSDQGVICPRSGKRFGNVITGSSFEDVSGGVYSMDDIRDEDALERGYTQDPKIVAKDHLAKFNMDGDPNDVFGDNGEKLQAVTSILNTLFRRYIYTTEEQKKKILKGLLTLHIQENLSAEQFRKKAAYYKTCLMDKTDLKAYAFQITKLWMFVESHSKLPTRIESHTLGALYFYVTGLKFESVSAIPIDKRISRILPHREQLQQYDFSRGEITAGKNAITNAYHIFLEPILVSKTQEPDLQSFGKLGSMRKRTSHFLAKDITRLNHKKLKYFVVPIKKARKEILQLEKKHNDGLITL
ncbi:MAG: hypothetical protein ACTSUE_23700 [Promethearchaeota archaeon]